MSALALVLTPYTWRGKTYKDIRNLMRAVDKVHPASAISFEPARMRVRDCDTNAVTYYAVERRVGDAQANAVAAEPTPAVRT